ncbi:unnamed protein product [Brachionus calyciflorus]|uniref:Uncharacterized protein n=1 Tax=Brachionus calyciflorus TaxID=104777 RepID=A0A814FM80_9BILA|nr:unnamed protein product [Brachionus calyciflorus]
MTRELNKPPPSDYKLTKGYCGYVITKKFANYAVFDVRALGLLDWLNNTRSSNEFYWSTLQFNTQIYSEHGAIADFNLTKNTLVRYTGWYPKYECKGRMRHGMCVFGIRDLPHLIKKPHFLANKFMLNVDPIAYQCMEEWFVEKEIRNPRLNLNYFCNFIKAKSNLVNC